MPRRPQAVELRIGDAEEPLVLTGERLVGDVGVAEMERTAKGEPVVPAEQQHAWHDARREREEHLETTPREDEQDVAYENHQDNADRILTDDGEAHEQPGYRGPEPGA